MVLLHQFLSQFYPSQSLPITPIILADFIAHLYLKGYAHSSISTYVAGITHTHKLHGFADPASDFVCQKLLAGAKKSNPSPDSRLPITFKILHLLLPALMHTVSSSYNRILLHAMFLLAFHGFLRVGEITSSPGTTNHTLQYHNIAFEVTARKVSGIIITFTHFKHSAAHIGTKLFIKASSPPTACPVKALLAYLRLRGSLPGPLFTFGQNHPVSRSFFSQSLASCISFIGLDPSKYKSHSFRIGAATTAQLLGHTPQQIKAMGRWRSDAFLRYIRIPMLSMI